MYVVMNPEQSRMAKMLSERFPLDTFEGMCVLLTIKAAIDDPSVGRITLHMDSGKIETTTGGPREFVVIDDMEQRG